MKLVIIAPSAIPSRTANSIQSMKMAQAFSQLGHEVMLLAPGDDPSLPWHQIAEHYGLNQRFQLEWLNSAPVLRRYDFALRAVSRARGWGADLLFTRLLQAAAIASRQGLLTIFEAHDMPGGLLGPVLFRQFLGGSGSVGLVSISQALANDLQAAYTIPPRSILLAPDAVDLERYQDLPSPQKARLQLNLPEQFTAGYTGHLYPGRGADFILELAAELPQITFLLVGGESQAVQQLQQASADLPNVIFTGFIPNAELPLYQAACDALLMPYYKQVSASSGGDIARYLSPMKMFEYLAAGRVILASDLPVLAEVLKSDNSIILPANNLRSWVVTLAELLVRPEMCGYLADNARRSAQRYSWRARAEKILNSIGIDQ